MAGVWRAFRKRKVAVAVATLLGLHAALLAWSARQHSPVVGEVNHLSAGLSHLKLGRYDLFRVNPPLVRTLAALPVACQTPTTDWRRYDVSPLARADLEVSQDFLKANGPRSLGYFTVGRWACIPLSLLGAYVCFRWARDLYGTSAGFVAMLLWCFCPYVLGHASLFTPDAHAAALGVAASYLFWRWLVRPGLTTAGLAGLGLGIAELSKFTLVVFYPLWVFIWMVYRLSEHGVHSRKLWIRQLGQLGGMLLLSVLIIQGGYEFEDLFQPLGKYQFKSQLLSGVEPRPGMPPTGGNRFTGSLVGFLPVPVPANYLQGIDVQRWDFERKMWSYLAGEWRFGGWWYYYLYALAVKIPLGTWCLVAMSVPCCLCSQYRAPWRDEMVLLLPALAILILVSSQTGFSVHSRYALSALPFVHIGCGRVARSLELGQRVLAAAVVLALAWSVGSSLWCYPHSLAYFNELTGGPKGGHRHLLDSNIAWGQDLYYLKTWLDEHPQARPFHLAYYGLMDPQLAGIAFTIPAVGPRIGREKPEEHSELAGPLPGWYAIDMNHLHGTRLAVLDGTGGWRSFSEEGYDLSYFQRFQPVAMAGYSIYVYHIAWDQANRVRRELGLSELPEAADPERAEAVRPTSVGAN